ncbi:MAG: hypothetical protein PHO31_01965, partial [Candidatus Pacebacteria bacterium]|nr:hypothetical protein [Candidatus Paceibacterota bacterium]
MGNIVKVFSKETQKNKKTLKKNKKRKFSKQKASRIFVLFFALIFILYFILIEISPQKTFASTSFYANYDSSLNATYSIGDGTGYNDGIPAELVSPGYGDAGKAVKVSSGETLRYKIENNLNPNKAEIEMKFQLPYDLLGDRGKLQFSSPSGIFYDSSSDFIYVADTSNNRIVKTKIDGTGWQTLGGPSSGSGQGQFYSPQGIFY